MKTFVDITDVVARCQFNNWRWRLKKQEDHVTLQVEAPDGTCNVTGEPWAWRGRKWRLSYHMTDTEIVQTCWLAVKTAMEHEMWEEFTYKGKTIFGPHWDVDFLARTLNEAPRVGEDARPPMPEQDTEQTLRDLMKSPAYWRDGDPEVVAKVRDGFRRLYPD